MSINKRQATMNGAMLELFRVEVRQQISVVFDGLRKIKKHEGAAEDIIESLIRAIHSLKGAAHLVQAGDAVRLSKVIEDVLVGCRKSAGVLDDSRVDLLMQGADLISAIGESFGTPQDSPTLRSERSALADTLISVLLAADGVSKAPHDPLDSSEVSDEGSAIRVAAPKSRQDHSSGARNTDTAFSDVPMMELFKMEIEQQTAILTDGLLRLEDNPSSGELIEPLMRAAHSIKGAARMVNVGDAVGLAHVMEDLLVGVQNGELPLRPDSVDAMFKAVDLLREISGVEGDTTSDQLKIDARALCEWITAYRNGDNPEPLTGYRENAGAGHRAHENNSASFSKKQPQTDAEENVPTELSGENEGDGLRSARKSPAPNTSAAKDRILRISADQINRLMGLAGESMVEVRWLRPYAESMLRLKRHQWDLINLIDSVREAVETGDNMDKVRQQLSDASRMATESRHILADRLSELESYDRRAVNLSSRLRREVVASRMRPFADGVQGFPRMVRDVARSLDKDVQLQIDGQATMVDRDILEKIEAPLNHLLRNAIDHAIEHPDERERLGKPRRGTIRLSAYHQSGMLSIVVEDDGRGVDLDRLRSKVVDKKLVSQEMAESMNESELMDFLFLPSFSTRDTVTEISGRGVGLNVVHDIVQEMRGAVRATSQLGRGTRFQLQLPLTLSVIPALLVEISGEPYALPLARIERIASISRKDIREVEGHQYVSLEDQNIGLVVAHQVLGLSSAELEKETLSVVVLGERKNCYGLVVDRFLGERDLVVHVLPAQLGKVKDISAAALMENGAPLLVIDVDDMLRSIEKIVSMGRLNRVDSDQESDIGSGCKRILVVDDSIMVREVERKLLEASGYDVEVAVDGMDGWNALRDRLYDLVITDIDMPRLDGIELVRMIRQEPRFKSMPVMIVSYKDREDDRIRGLEAGADYYLTKGSFHDETLREAVRDLIGAAA